MRWRTTALHGAKNGFNAFDAGAWGVPRPRLKMDRRPPRSSTASAALTAASVEPCELDRGCLAGPTASRDAR